LGNEELRVLYSVEDWDMKAKDFKFCNECKYCNPYSNPILSECLAPRNYKEKATPFSLYLVKGGKFNAEDIHTGVRYHKYCWQHRALGISDILFGDTTCTKHGLWYKRKVEDLNSNKEQVVPAAGISTEIPAQSLNILCIGLI
jgi:hypothetical protein